MNNNDFVKLMEKAKKDNNSLMFILDKYSPLLKKYSTINGFFYEDLYENMIEIIIKLIKNYNVPGKLATDCN